MCVFVCAWGGGVGGVGRDWEGRERGGSVASPFFSRVERTIFFINE